MTFALHYVDQMWQEGYSSAYLQLSFMLIQNDLFGTVAGFELVL